MLLFDVLSVSEIEANCVTFKLFLCWSSLLSRDCVGWTCLGNVEFRFDTELACVNDVARFAAAKCCCCAASAYCRLRSNAACSCSCFVTAFICFSTRLVIVEVANHLVSTSRLENQSDAIHQQVTFLVELSSFASKLTDLQPKMEAKCSSTMVMQLVIWIVGFEALVEFVTWVIVVAVALHKDQIAAVEASKDHLETSLVAN